jgi:hypothetical protein
LADAISYVWNFLFFSFANLVRTDFWHMAVPGDSRNLFHFILTSDCVKYYIMLSIKVFWKEKMVHIPRVVTVKWRQTNFAAFLSLSLLGNVFKNLYNFSLILSKKKSCHYITVYNKLYLFLGFLFLNWWD